MYSASGLSENSEISGKIWYLRDLQMILKCPNNIKFKFKNGTLYFFCIFL